MSKYLNAKTRKGFTLLEVIIAIFLIVVGIAGAFLLITRTISTMSLSSSRLVAAYLTQEGIEIVRNIRDTNWIEGAPSWDDGLSAGDWEVDYNDPDLSSYSGNPLNIETATDFYGYDSGTPTKFKRKITIVPLISPDRLEVTVETTWTEKGKAHSHTAQEILYNWR